MRLRRWILWVVLALPLGVPGVGIAQVDDAPSLAGGIDIHAHAAPETSMLNFKRAFDANEAALPRPQVTRDCVRDYTAFCLPWGYTRAMQTEYPVEIIQTPKRFVYLFESNNIFHVVPTDGRSFRRSWIPSGWGRRLAGMKATHS